MTLREAAQTAILTEADVAEIVDALEATGQHNRLAYALRSRLGRPALAQPESEPAATHKTTGWMAPVDRYAMPVLFSPYTGEPRDVHDVQSDPQGILIVPPGKVEMLAAKPTGKQLLQVESITDCMMNLVDRLGSESADVDAQAWGHLMVYVPQEPTLVQPESEPSDRADLIAKLRAILTGPAALTTKEAGAIQFAADMLEADAQEIENAWHKGRADGIEENEQINALLAQQVAVPQGPAAWLYESGTIGGCDYLLTRTREVEGSYAESAMWHESPLYAAPQDDLLTYMATHKKGYDMGFAEGIRQARGAQQEGVPHHTTHNGAAVVGTEMRWIPIDATTPHGAKCLVIEKSQGIAYLREVRAGDGFTHWHPLPKF